MTFDRLQRRSTGDVTQPSSCSQSKPTIESSTPAVSALAIGGAQPCSVRPSPWEGYSSSPCRGGLTGGTIRRSPAHQTFRRCTTTEQALCRSTDYHPGPRTCAFGWLTRRTSARPTRSRDTRHLHRIPLDPTPGDGSEETSCMSMKSSV